MRRKHFGLLIILCNISFWMSCNNPIRTSDPITIFQEMNLSQVDSIYKLNDSLSILIKEGTFNRNESVKIKYQLANDSVMLLSNLSTLNSFNKHIKTVGMLNISFENSEGKEVFPALPYCIILNSVKADSTIKTFYGIEDDELIKWKEESSESRYIIDFKSNIKNGTEEISLLIEGMNIRLTDFLDSVFQIGTQDKKIEDSQVYFKRVNDYYCLDTIITTNRNFREELSKVISNLSLIDYESEFVSSSFFEEGLTYKYGIQIDLIDLYPNIKNESIIYSTVRTGWFNFDIYINSPYTELKVIDVKKGEIVKLLSMSNNRVILPESIEDGTHYFSFPIENYEQKFKVYKIVDKRIERKNDILLSQEKETILSL